MLYTTTLGDENVYITEHPPHQSNHPYSRHLSEISVPVSEPADIVTTFKATVDVQSARISSLTSRAMLIHKAGSIDVIDKIDVSITSSVSTINVTPSSKLYQTRFPAPSPAPKMTIHVGEAKDSAYVEIVASLNSAQRCPDFMYPMMLGSKLPVVWNMPYLNLDLFPKLDTSKTNRLKWLTSHTSLQMSARERASRAKHIISPNMEQKDLRINFKDSLFSLFIAFSGLEGPPVGVFSLNDISRGGVEILIFVSSLRLDQANHTAVLNAAVLPLTGNRM